MSSPDVKEMTDTEILTTSSKDSCLSTEFDFNYSVALATVRQDCTDEKIMAEIFQLALKKEEKAAFDRVHRKYRFENIIGKGSSGIVHLVIHKETGKKYACKVLVRNAMNDHDSMSIEIEIMKTVNHDNVVVLHELFESATRLWLIMELTNTGGLRSIFRKDVTLPEADTRRLVMQMLSAIRYLHNLGIIHRDLKIENILFLGKASTGIIKIADFGLSAVITPGTKGYHPSDSNKRKKFTGMSDRCGTGTYYFLSALFHLSISLSDLKYRLSHEDTVFLLYKPTVTHCSPELLFKKAYGPQTDMWSLGCIVYEMLAGSAAFSA